MKRLAVIIIFSLMAVQIKAQESFPQYRSPLEIPVYLSATFAELRTNSFHGGIDIKTQGVEGKRVFAVADGYISRIGVSPYGYGNVVYITHYDGYTSVYAHLQCFNKEITKFVRNFQYRNKVYSSTTIYPSKSDFPIKAGDYLGLSGNSGSSGGPHLHFEIRHTKSEKPVNPLYFGLKVADDVRPTIKGVAVYPAADDATVERNDQPKYYAVEGKKDNYRLKDKSIVFANGRIAFGIDTDDQVGSSPNKNGPYTYELYLDDELRFKVECDSFSYDEPRYINSMIDYKRFKEKGNRYVRTIVDPNNRLSMYVVKDGVVQVNEGDTVNVCFKITDYAGNVSAARFKVVGSEPVVVEKEPIRRSQYFVTADGSQNSRIEIENFQVILGKDVLFKDTWMQTGATDPKGCCSRCYRFGEDTQAVFKLFKVRIKPDEKWADNEKLFIAHIDSKGKVSSLGGKMASDGYVETNTRTLGQYALKIDSIPPTIKSLSFRENDTVTSKTTLKMKIADDMTGIDSYNMYANDNWILGQYDAKYDLLYYEVDSYMKPGRNTVKIVVKDAVGNTTIKKVNVYRK